jgi:hypothetical protein
LINLGLLSFRLDGRTQNRDFAYMREVGHARAWLAPYIDARLAALTDALRGLGWIDDGN